MILGAGGAVPGSGRLPATPSLAGLLGRIAAGHLGLELDRSQVREWELGGASYALGVQGDRALLLVGPRGFPSIGAGLVALGARPLTRLDVIALGEPEELRAEARAYRLDVALWRAGPGGRLVPVEMRARPGWAEPPPLPDNLAQAATSLGVVRTVGDGRWALSWRGLEVGEVRWSEGGSVVVELGVGRLDRRARAELATERGASPVGRELARVVEAVARWRRPDVPAHPANQLGLGGWLADAVCARPEAVGLVRAELVALDPDPRARSAFGVATLGDGSELPAVFVVGFDPRALGAAEVLWSRIGRRDPDPGRLALVHPVGDPRAAWSTLIGYVRRDVVDVEVASDWRAWGLAGGR